MQLTEVSAKTGYVWFRQGLWLFRKNPFAFLTLVILYTFVAMLVAWIPVFGAVALPLLFVPGFAAGFMAAGREAVMGKPVFPTMLFDGFVAHGKPAAHRLLWLGLLYMVIMALETGLLTLLVLSTVDNSLLAQIIKTGMAPMPGNDAAVPNGLLTIMLACLAWQILSMLITLVFWLAAVTSAWHDASPAKALFFSVVGVWRNRGAFLVYGALWYGVMIIVPSLLSFVMMKMGMDLGTVQMVMMPVLLVIFTMIGCSLYAVYRGCFGVQEQAPQPGAHDTGARGNDLDA